MPAMMPAMAAKKTTTSSPASGPGSRLGGRPTVLTGAWADLAAKAGGVDALAALLKSSRSSVLKWAKGTLVPSDARVLVIRMIARDLRAKSPV